MRNLLVVSEVAAALVLLAGAGLMLRTVWSLARVNPGFDPHHVLTFSVGLSPPTRAAAIASSRPLSRPVDRIQRVPGVKSAAVSSSIPLGGSDSEIPST